MISVQGLEVERAGDIQLLLETFYSGRKQALSTEVDIVSMWILSKNKLSSLFPFSTYLQLRTQLLILWLLFFRRRTLSVVMPLGKIYVCQFSFLKCHFEKSKMVWCQSQGVSWMMSQCANLLDFYYNFTEVYIKRKRQMSRNDMSTYIFCTSWGIENV